VWFFVKYHILGFFNLYFDRVTEGLVRRGDSTTGVIRQRIQIIRGGPPQKNQPPEFEMPPKS
jgi:hypothetical protein